MATLHAPSCRALKLPAENPRDWCSCGAHGVRPRRTMLDYIDECKRIAARVANATELALTPYDNLPDEMQKALDAGDAERAAQAANMIRAIYEAAHPMVYVSGAGIPPQMTCNGTVKMEASADGKTYVPVTLSASGEYVPNRFSFIAELAQQGVIDRDEAKALLEIPQAHSEWSRDYLGVWRECVPAPDPIDVKYDGVKLRDLLIDDERARRYEGTHPRFTPRAARRRLRALERRSARARRGEQGPRSASGCARGGR